MGDLNAFLIRELGLNPSGAEGISLSNTFLSTISYGTGVGARESLLPISAISLGLSRR